MGRLAIFIDGGYLDRVLLDEFQGARLDYVKFVDCIWREIARRSQEPIDILRSYYYHCMPYQGHQPTPDESVRYAQMRRFKDALERLPRFQVRMGRLELRGVDRDGKPVFQQKQVDLMLGLDIAQLCAKGRVTHVALVAGDSDFLPAFESACQDGASVWLIHGPSVTKNGRPSFHWDLWTAADERIEITPDMIHQSRRS